MSSKWVFGIGLTLLLGLAAYGTVRTTQISAVSESETATPSSSLDAKNTIAALGRIAPEGEVLRVGGPSGSRIASLKVKEGEIVEKDQIIAILDSFDERQAERDLAISQLEEAKIIFATEEQLGVMQTQEAETRLQQAREPQTQAIKSQEAVIKRIAVELQQARQELDRYTTLQRKGAVTLQALEARQLTALQKREELEAAKSRFLQLREEQLANERNALAQIESAKAQSVKSQAQVQLNSAARRLQLAESRLEQSVIRAPIDGQIIKVLLRNGESIEPAFGEGNSGQAIVELGRTQQMYVIAEVYETDIAAITRGMKATMTSSAFEGEIRGVVDKIGLKIGKNDVLNTDPAANTDARVIEVKIRLLDSQKVEKLTNLQVDVLIGAKS